MKVAAVQMTSGPDVRRTSSRHGAARGGAARGARLAALPENFAFMGLADVDKRAVAEAAAHGPIQDFLAATARRLRLWRVAGTVATARRRRRRVAAASLVYDARGERVARYDKIHLFDVDMPGRPRAIASRRTSRRAPRRKPSTPPSAGSDSRCATTCASRSFSEVERRRRAALVVPSAFTSPTGRAHWETLLRARAIENLCYVIAPAQSGIHPSGRETYGDSMIVDFWGRILQRVPRGTGCAVAELDLQRQSGVRETFPALVHRVFTEEIPTNE